MLSMKKFIILNFIFATTIITSCKDSVTFERYRLGLTEFKKENYHDAITLFDSVIKDKNFEFTNNAYLKRGISKYKIGDYLGALNDLEKLNSLQYIDDNNERLCYIGNAKIKIKKYNDAISFFSKVLNSSGKRIVETGDFDGIDKKNYAIAFCGRALAEFELKNYQMSQKDCDSASLLDSEISDIYILKGKLNKINNKEFCSYWWHAAKLGDTSVYLLLKDFCN